MVLGVIALTPGKNCIFYQKAYPNNLVPGLRGSEVFSSLLEVPLILIVLLCSFFFAVSADVPASVPVAVQAEPVPADLRLRIGETYVRSVPSGDVSVPPAYIFRLPDGKVAVSWRGVRSPAFDAFDATLSGSTDGIRFRDGWMQFRAIRQGRTMAMSMMDNVPNLGWVMLLQDYVTQEITLVFNEVEYPVYDIRHTYPSSARGFAFYDFVRSGHTIEEIVAPVCVGGTPNSIVLPGPGGVTIFMEIEEGGADVQFWVWR